MKVLILAAGYATRLYPRTIHFPKPLLEVNKKPIINYLIEKVERLPGVSKVIIVTNDRFAGTFKRWAKQLDTPLDICIVNDRTRTPEERLGAVGDMSLVFKKESFEGDFLVLGGDNFFQDPLDAFTESARRKDVSATIGVFDIRRRKEASSFGVVNLDFRNRVIDFEEKPKIPRSSLIAMCLYYFPQKALRSINEYMADPRNSSDAAGAYIGWLSRNYAVYGYRFRHLWVDIGNKQTYMAVNKLLKGKE
jgi:glucose-1-phosphate thymidylyltransferase